MTVPKCEKYKYVPIATRQIIHPRKVKGIKSIC